MKEEQLPHQKPGPLQQRELEIDRMWAHPGLEDIRKVNEELMEIELTARREALERRNCDGCD